MTAPRRPTTTAARWLMVLALLLGAVACTRDDDGDERVLLVGDSLMSQTGQALTFQRTPGVDFRNEGVSGSGLLSPWLFDWPAHLRRVLDNYDPDVVVFLFVGNYDIGSDQRYTTDDGERIEDRRSDGFAEAWREEAAELTRMAAESADAVIWVLPPPMQSRRDQAVVDALREGYEQVVEDVDGASSFDAYEVLADEDGGYLARAPGPGDGPVRLRTRDGVHLAPAGAQRLATALAEVVEAA